MVLRAGLAAVLVVIAFVWPFTHAASHAAGPVLVRFGNQHGIDLGDLLSLAFVGAAVVVLNPARLRRWFARRRAG